MIKMDYMFQKVVDIHLLPRANGKYTCMYMYLYIMWIFARTR